MGRKAAKREIEKCKEKSLGCFEGMVLTGTSKTNGQRATTTPSGRANISYAGDSLPKKAPPAKSVAQREAPRARKSVPQVQPLTCEDLVDQVLQLKEETKHCCAKKTEGNKMRGWSRSRLLRKVKRYSLRCQGHRSRSDGFGELSVCNSRGVH